MGVFILNEWFWSDLNGENEGNGPLQLQVAKFLGALYQSDHQIIYILGSKFETKAKASCGSHNLGVQQFSLEFVTSTAIDCTHFRSIHERELMKLPHKLEKMVKNDDHYLVRGLLTINEAILVTTDEALITALGDLPGRCLSRKEFYETYFNIHSKGL